VAPSVLLKAGQVVTRLLYGINGWLMEEKVPHEPGYKFREVQGRLHSNNVVICFLLR
jgi:hypothetical protein